MFSMMLIIRQIFFQKYYVYICKHGIMVAAASCFLVSTQFNYANLLPQVCYIPWLLWHCPSTFSSVHISSCTQLHIFFSHLLSPIHCKCPHQRNFLYSTVSTNILAFPFSSLVQFGRLQGEVTGKPYDCYIWPREQDLIKNPGSPDKMVGLFANISSSWKRLDYWNSKNCSKVRKKFEHSKMYLQHNRIHIWC